MKDTRFSAVLILFLLMTIRGWAQERYRLFNNNIIREVREDPTNPAPSSFDVVGYKPDLQFKMAWENIIQQIRTPTNSEILDSILIRSADIQTIYSTRTVGKNIIFYDKDFFSQFEGIPYIDVNYLISFSFLHEIAHFVNGDVQNQIRSRDSESKADRYACESLCRMMEASPEKVQSVILSLDGATNSQYYYSKGIRLKNIQQFFDDGQCSVSPAVHFDFDSSVLRTESYKSLDMLSSTLRANSKKIKIVGYYFTGIAADDLQTSINNANAVKTYLINSGVAASRIATEGRGQSNPVANNATEEGRRLNRRVEFLLY